MGCFTSDLAMKAYPGTTLTFDTHNSTFEDRVVLRWLFDGPNHRFIPQWNSLKFGKFDGAGFIKTEGSAHVKAKYTPAEAQQRCHRTVQTTANIGLWNGEHRTRHC